MTQQVFPDQSNLNWHKWYTKFMYVIIYVHHLIDIHFNKNMFDKIIYADINLNPKCLNWQILKMKIYVFSPCKEKNKWINR